MTQCMPNTPPGPTPRRFRGIRLATLMIGVAVCGVLLGLGVEIYRAWSPVRRWTRESRPGNSQFTRLQAVLNLTYDVPAAEREAAFPVLLEAVKDADPMIRAEAITALREAQGSLRRSLRDLQESDEGSGSDRPGTCHLPPGVIHQARYAEESTLLPEVAAALDDASPAVRLEACRALYVYGQLPRAVPALTRLVREEKGIYRQGGLGFLLVGKTIPKELEPTLRAMLGDENALERGMARRALIQMGVTERERDDLIRAMLESPKSAERLAAAQVLMDLGKPLDGGVRHEGLGRRDDSGCASAPCRDWSRCCRVPGAERLAAAEALHPGRPARGGDADVEELADHGDAATSAAAARLLDAARSAASA